MALNQTDFTQLNAGDGGDKMSTTTDGDVKVQHIRPVFVKSGEIYAVTELDASTNTGRLPVLDLAFFDLDGTIGQSIGDTFTWVNPCGFASVGFHLVPPAGGTVVFEGTFDDTNWTSITLRSIDSDEFRNHAHTAEDFIGSISTLRQFRVRVTEAGSAPGSLQGRVIRNVSTIEGIEHGNPPHNIGYNIIRFGVDVDSVVTDQDLFVPSSEDSHSKKFVISGYQMSLSGNDNVTIYDETDASNNWIFAASVKVASSESQFAEHQFNPPFVSAAQGNKVKIMG